MAKEISNTGLFFDELNKIRVLQPEVFQQTTQLKEDCKDFVEKITEFHKFADGFIQMVDGLAREVESETMKAIGVRNLLKSVTKQREAEQQQLQACITEKAMELERLRVQHQSLLKTEQEQQELIEQLVLNR
ncbi:intraflagellar transport protein 20 homolog [Bacillus rossius redtenbacheri]|uniref:intraflagellar transport protein 20 homolog n=1 Tax=Bacillus rossius redtenbacheri TaxID=93214 RepID=UPI002FDDBB05